MWAMCFPKLRRSAAGCAGQIAAVGLALAMVAGWATAGLAASPAGARSLQEMVAPAELVFHGVVDNIEYVLSEPVGPEQVRVPYTVSKGQQVQVEFTYENSGETTQIRRAGYYLSTNSTINTADRRVATQTFTLERDNVRTVRTTLTLPTMGLTSGATYYLGVIIDDNRGLAEVDEANNAAYHIIKVK